MEKAHINFDTKTVVFFNEVVGRHEVSIEKFVEEAQAGLDAKMLAITVMDSGIRINFGNRYFVKGGTAEERSRLNAQKAEAQVELYKAFKIIGMSEPDVAFSTGYTDRSTNQWRSSMQLWLNKPDSAQKTANNSSSVTLEQKMLDAVAAGVDFETIEEAQGRYASNEMMFKLWLSSAIKKVLSKPKQAEEVAPEQAGEAAPESDNPF